MHKKLPAERATFYVPPPEKAKETHDQIAARTEARHQEGQASAAEEEKKPEDFLYGVSKYVPPPPVVGVNCPTSVVPDDLFACVSEFKRAHPTEDWDVAEPRLSKFRMVPTDEQRAELAALGNPQPTEHEPPLSPSKIGPGGVYATRYKHKYKYRRNLGSPDAGYESPDSSCSDDSFESASDDEDEELV